jgi:Concanavalin A-like lectin/glucanases superfamily
MPLGAFRLNSIAKVLGGPPAFNTITATGGTINNYEDSGVWYRSHTFENIRTNKAVTTIGNTQTSTAQFKFGSSSALFDGTGDQLYCYAHNDFTFGTGDFTIELWVRNTSWATTEYIFDMRTGASTVNAQLFYNSGVRYATGGTTRITGGTLSVNTWHHIAISKSGTSTRLFINGTQSGSTYTDNNNYAAAPLNFGTDFAAANGYSGNMDEIRVSKTARYTANFTAPSAVFTNDVNTTLLLHCEGTNTQQRFPDDSTLASTFAVSSLGSSNGKVQYLLVAGGGAGGAHDGLFRTPGGGGAGGLKIGTSTVTTTNYTVSVGAGGQGATGRNFYTGTTYSTISPMNGGNSSVFSISATGGGGGGMYSTQNTGNNGGSGGGGGAGDGTTAKVGGTGVSGEGSNGGQSYANGANGDLAGGGGGGGKTSAGSNSDYANNKGGAGGAGVNYTYRDGTTIGYAGGGGGAGFSTTANNTSQGGAATHGGGAGNAYARGFSGTASTGGGGGAGNGLGYVFQSGGDGGSGVVVIRYPWNSANNIP